MALHWLDPGYGWQRQGRAVSRCETCRFMAADRGGLLLYDPKTDDWEPSNYHTCVRVIHGNAEPFRTEAPDVPALVVDGSGYAARLVVLPTFGCVLHEAKETGSKE